MATATRVRPTWWDEVFRVLAFEFDAADQADSDRKIKRRLREKKLGRWDPRRVGLARAFKDDVRRELGQPRASAFFREKGSGIAVPEDWEFQRLAAHLKRRHPRVPAREVGRFLWGAIYLYYLR